MMLLFEDLVSDEEVSRSPISKYGITETEQNKFSCGNCGKIEENEHFKSCKRCCQLRIDETHEFYKHYCSKTCQIEHWKVHRHEHMDLETDERKLEKALKNFFPRSETKNIWFSEEHQFSEKNDWVKVNCKVSYSDSETIKKLLRKLVKYEVTKIIFCGGGNFIARVKEHRNQEMKQTLRALGLPPLPHWSSDDDEDEDEPGEPKVFEYFA